MPFVNKEIQLREFLMRVQERLVQKGGESVVLFEHYVLNELRPEGTPEGWDGIVNAGNFDEIYPRAVEILHETASRLLGESHPTVYQDADGVSTAFCEELNEFFECSGEHLFRCIPIRSHTEMMIEAGLMAEAPSS